MARKTRKKASAAETEVVERIEDVDITGVMRSSYADYAAAVVIGRALPDVRDGLKPVHRRILWSMKESGFDANGPLRKSARIVGDVMGKYHPHGDSSIYEALARLTQPWSVTLPLITGQGNFGSPDGDNPAAMRYTEAKLAPVARFLVDDLNRDTVDFRPNYDGTEREPVVLPSAFPHILVNGTSGIAVGMATDMPTHNLGEVIDATLLRLRDPEISLDGLMSAMPGPDYPTGGRIIGNAGIRKAYETGRGTITIEATTHFEKDGKNPLIVYTDMPWGVTRPAVLSKINEMINDGKMPDIISARDETDRTGARFVVELRAGADPEYVDSVLKTQTPVRSGGSLNFTLVDGRGVPGEMGLAKILDEWIDFRRLTVRRRATFDLKKARDRGRLLLGRMAALSIIDKIVKMIRQSKTREEAIEAICAATFKSADFAELVELLGTREQRKGKTFKLERFQAEDILAMRLQRLTGMEREALIEEGRKIVHIMNELREILSNPGRLDDVIAEELEAVRATGVQDRKTVIDADATVSTARAATPVAPLEATWVIQTEEGHVARAKKGVPEDMTCKAWSTDTHARLVFFTDKGMAYGVDLVDLPALEAKEDPRPIPGLLGLTPLGDVVSTLVLTAAELAVPEDGGKILTFVSADGYVRRTQASEFARIPNPGKMAMKLTTDDPALLSVFADSDKEPRALFMGTAQGKIIRFALEDLRVMSGRSSRGVRGMKLEGDDRVVGAFEVPNLTLSAELCEEVEKGWLGKTPKKDLSKEALALLEGPEVLQVAATGHTKRTLLHAYRQTKRDNRGINDRGPAKTIGEMVGYALIEPGQDSITLREPTGLVNLGVEGLRKGGRATTGAISGETPTGIF